MAHSTAHPISLSVSRSLPDSGPDGPLEALAIKVSAVAELEGEFTLRSGLAATNYFDKYQFECRPELLSAVADHLVPMIPDDVEVLAGLELGGVPLATALSLRTGLPMVLVRKTAKTYGTSKLAEGPLIAGRKLLIVEDVVTTGGQIVESVSALRALGAEIDRAVCVIDRDQGGRGNLLNAGLDLLSLFTPFTSITNRVARLGAHAVHYVH